MADALGGALLTVLVGSVTGAMGVPVFVAWVLRRAGHSPARGRRAGLTIWAATILWFGLAAWLVVGTPFV